MKIKVYKSPLSDKVIAVFKSMKKLEAYLDKNPNIFADQIAINGLVILGFDEIGL